MLLGGGRGEPARRIVEMCAEESSRIGEIATNCQCEVIRLTNKTKVCSRAGRKMAIQAVMTRKQQLVWGSMPHKGKTNDELITQRELFDALWFSFEKVALENHRRQGKVAIEWPKGCVFWRLPHVQKFM